MSRGIRGCGRIAGPSFWECFLTETSLVLVVEGFRAWGSEFAESGGGAVWQLPFDSYFLVVIGLDRNLEGPGG